MFWGEVSGQFDSSKNLMIYMVPVEGKTCHSALSSLTSR